MLTVQKINYRKYLKLLKIKLYIFKNLKFRFLIKYYCVAFLKSTKLYIFKKLKFRFLIKFYCVAYLKFINDPT